MTYATGTITNAAPAATLVGVIETALTATGWTFVETVVITTVTHRVWKNPAANNSQGADYFVDLYYTTTAGLTLQFHTSEVWDATNKKMIRYCPQTANLTPSAAAAPFTYAVNDTTGVLLSSSLLYPNPTFTLITTGFSYWLHVSTDHFQLATTNGAAMVGVYIGLYDSFMSLTDDPFPLTQVAMQQPGSYADVSVGSGTSVGGACTREPKQAAALTANFSTLVSGTNWTPATAAEGYSGKPMLSRTLISGRNNSGGGTPTHRGLLKDSLNGSVGTQVNGDTFTFTIGATTYTYVRAAHGSTHNLWMPTT